MLKTFILLAGFFISLSVFAQEATQPLTDEADQAKPKIIAADENGNSLPEAAVTVPPVKVETKVATESSQPTPEQIEQAKAQFQKILEDPKIAEQVREYLRQYMTSSSNTKTAGEGSNPSKDPVRIMHVDLGSSGTYNTAVGPSWGVNSQMVLGKKALGGIQSPELAVTGVLHLGPAPAQGGGPVHIANLDVNGSGVIKKLIDLDAVLVGGKVNADLRALFGAAFDRNTSLGIAASGKAYGGVRLKAAAELPQVKILDTYLDAIVETGGASSRNQGVPIVVLTVRGHAVSCARPTQATLHWVCIDLGAKLSGGVAQASTGGEFGLGWMFAPQVSDSVFKSLSVGVKGSADALVDTQGSRAIGQFDFINAQIRFE